jgi:hypothetical protein
MFLARAFHPAEAMLNGLAPDQPDISSIVLRAVRSAYSSWRLRLPFC